MENERKTYPNRKTRKIPKKKQKKIPKKIRTHSNMQILTITYYYLATNNMSANQVDCGWRPYIAPSSEPTVKNGVVF